MTTLKERRKKKLEGLFRFKLTALDTKKNLDASFLFFFSFPCPLVFMAGMFWEGAFWAWLGAVDTLLLALGFSCVRL